MKAFLSLHANSSVILTVIKKSVWAVMSVRLFGQPADVCLAWQKRRCCHFIGNCESDKFQTLHGSPYPFNFFSVVTFWVNLTVVFNWQGIRVGTQVDSGEENSPTPPAGIQTRNLLITSPALLPTSYLGVCSTPVLLQWHVKDPGHSAKSAGGRLHLNMHTPLTQWSQSGLTMPLSRHSVGTYLDTS